MSYTHVQRVRNLYKSILKLNRGLPKDLAMIGTAYAREEFRRNKNLNEKQANAFLFEWGIYAIRIADQLKDGSPHWGATLHKNHLHSLSDEQVYQLFELMEATKGARPQKS